ncbi:MAG: hypothetical protein A3D31_06165 [Candidatus Fluviicola riflensis]|nr:MAG: hypothetical protein CHH17_08850 [Candidatus Fluviicola riflensis]OGS79547.1 MAG: hypothetical protein A3D31_06165 [Candidatus Fluviicola riflensis]OGS86978.1 MAG: hypothetical protein A2724_05625 [Fluviicola sp. RIFCSPHIGHO2_01_FULL_43_53]OGS89769.1 MAG: hypothetical protein A3E30_02370 [Fluviicola sp. RIFCSPHIGHO2_12_FULL_43_24]
MRLPIILCCFLRIAYSPALAQPVDSIQISLSTKSADTLVLNQLYAIDGRYKIPAENLMRYPVLANYVLVQPTTLTGPDKILCISSQADLVQQSPAYEFRRYPYIPYVYVEPPVDTIDEPVYNNYNEGTIGILDGLYIMEGPHFDTLKLRCRNNSDWKHLWFDYYVKYGLAQNVTGSQDSLILALKNEFQQYRSTVAQPVINEFLEPFYMAQSEVTNAQYREFVHWVRDSITFDLLYHELEDYDAVQLLNCTKKQRSALDYSDPDSLAVYLKRYGFNYNYFKEKKINIYNYYDNEEYYQIVSQLFLPQPERFYKRNEFDTRRFIYRSGGCSPTPVFPDTVCWLNDTPHADYDAIARTYFWHPAYNNHPVVGVNEAQMKAYCDWLQHRKNKELKDAPYAIRVELPQLIHYEMAVKHCAPVVLRNQINAQTETPFILTRSPEDALWFINRSSPYSSKEILAIKGHSPRLADWHTINQTYPIWCLTGGVSEYCSESATPQDQMTVLGGNYLTGLVDKQENQLNTALYQQVVSADKGSSMVGFRPVMYIDWKK